MRRTNARNGKSRDLAGEMIKGAIAGAIGTWVMDRVTWELYLTEDPKAFEQEKQAQFEGKYGAHVTADKVAERTGRSCRMSSITGSPRAFTIPGERYRERCTGHSGTGSGRWASRGDSRTDWVCSS